MRASTGWCLLSASLALGCGGATRETVEEPGPPHEGQGLYDLTIERVSDDCQPPLLTGEVGPVVVIVTADGAAANVPLYEVADALIGPARTDVSFEDAQSFDVPFAPQPDCSFTNLHIEISVPLANAERIDVAYERTLSGTATCPSQFGGMRDCSSHRLFHFRWLRACAADRDITECAEE